MEQQFIPGGTPEARMRFAGERMAQLAAMTAAGRQPVNLQDIVKSGLNSQSYFMKGDSIH